METITPIDPSDITTHSFLASIQGNILKGHGREHTTHIFIHFDKGKAKRAKEWLKDYAKIYLTSCLKQLNDRDAFKRDKKDGGLFSSIFLSSSGLKYLGFEGKLNDEGFNAGMKERSKVLNDPDNSKLEKGFREDIDLMILLADNDLRRMGNLARTIIEEVDTFARISAIEYGNAIKNANGDGLEHFGYVDGISQPLFLKDEIDAYKGFPNSIKVGNGFNPVANSNLVLIKDPYVKEEDKEHAFGSYFVFRKLEQNVRGFKKAEEDLGLGEIGGAYLVGRFEDGTPVIAQEDDGLYGSGSFNNFDYQNDPSGGRCPHFAHIRKTNPRSNEADKSHIMARRGIPFGHREVPTDIKQDFAQMPEGGVGLLFMSYQASIENQFEFIQEKWANNIAFPSDTNTGIDPIIGQSDADKHKYNFPLEYREAKPTKELSFGKFVAMKGGEYFFAPSMPFFKNL